MDFHFICVKPFSKAITAQSALAKCAQVIVGYIKLLGYKHVYLKNLPAEPSWYNHLDVTPL